MFDFNGLVARFRTSAATTYVEQMERVELLRGADSVHVSKPECDDAGGFWFFISGHVQGEPISIPHVVTGITRVVEVRRLAETYRRSVLHELNRRGFAVAAQAETHEDRYRP